MRRTSRNRLASSGGAMVLALSLVGCATTGTSPGQRLDPFESWNRKVFSFNESLDQNVVAPVARGYRAVVPGFVRQGVTNVFNNFADGWSAVNNFLQGKGEAGFQDLTRFGTNTVFGFLGVLDIATEMGLEHHYEDFGQTLGVWGFGAGAYIVWPILGPSSVRDTVAMPLDRGIASPVAYIDDTGVAIGVGVLQLINARSNFLGASGIIDDIALDKYTFVRDAYLQRRRSLVFDGDAPEQPAGRSDAGDAAEPASGAASQPAATAPADPTGAGAVAPAASSAR
ncbi:MAG: putative lipoprotein [Rhizobacter sp.]|nr:putative lipoprotein [Rhizobacter sp.]